MKNLNVKLESVANSVYERNAALQKEIEELNRAQHLAESQRQAPIIVNINSSANPMPFYFVNGDSAATVTPQYIKNDNMQNIGAKMSQFAGTQASASIHRGKKISGNKKITKAEKSANPVIQKAAASHCQLPPAEAVLPQWSQRNQTIEPQISKSSPTFNLPLQNCKNCFFIGF